MQSCQYWLRTINSYSEPPLSSRLRWYCSLYTLYNRCVRNEMCTSYYTSFTVNTSFYVERPLTSSIRVASWFRGRGNFMLLPNGNFTQYTKHTKKIRFTKIHVCQKKYDSIFSSMRWKVFEGYWKVHVIGRNLHCEKTHQICMGKKILHVMEWCRIGQKYILFYEVYIWSIPFQNIYHTKPKCCIAAAADSIRMKQMQHFSFANNRQGLEYSHKQ